MNGVTPTTGDTGSGTSLNLVTKGATAAILEYTNVLKAHGQLGYRLATRGTVEASNFDLNLSADGDGFARFYFTTDELPSTGRRVLSIRHPAQTIIGGIWLSTGGNVNITDGTDANITSSPIPVVAVNTFTRIEVSVVVSTVNSALIRVWTYLGDSGTATYDSGNVPVTTQAGAVAQARIFRFGFGSLANNPTATGFWYFDDIATATAADGKIGAVLLPSPGWAPLRRRSNSVSW